MSWSTLPNTFGVGSDGAERRCAEDLPRRAHGALGSGQGPGGPLASVVPEEAPGVVGASHPHLRSKPDQRSLALKPSTRPGTRTSRRPSSRRTASSTRMRQVPPRKVRSRGRPSSQQAPRCPAPGAPTREKIRRWSPASTPTATPTTLSSSTKGQRMQPAWIEDNNGVPDAKYTVTESSFIQSHVFLGYLQDFREQLDARGLQGQVALVLDGHASHTTFDAISLAISLDIDLFQLPSHTSHITQPLDVGSFGTFKKELMRVLTAYPLKNGGEESGGARHGSRDCGGMEKELHACEQHGGIQRGGLVSGEHREGHQPATQQQEATGE
ncbi:unnamed protein product [Ectocarpus sp. 4 AP-2014]